MTDKQFTAILALLKSIKFDIQIIASIIVSLFVTGMILLFINQLL